MPWVTKLVPKLNGVENELDYESCIELPLLENINHENRNDNIHTIGELLWIILKESSLLAHSGYERANNSQLKKVKKKFKLI